MDRERLAARLKALFLEELDEHARGFRAEALALERTPSPGLETETIKSLLRRVHSLKGSAAAVDRPEIAAACHRIEEVLASVRDGKRSLTREVLDIIAQVPDALEETHARLRDGQDLAGAGLLTLGEQLRGAGPSRAPAAAPASQAQETPAEALAPTMPSVPSFTLRTTTGAANASPSSQTASRGAGQAPREGSVRVATSKIDALLLSSRELAVARGRLEERIADAAALQASMARVRDGLRSSERLLSALAQRDGSPHARRAAAKLQKTREEAERAAAEADRVVTSLERGIHELNQIATPCEEDVLRMRMAPIAEACEPLEGAARDVARSAGKLVELRIAGGDVEIDRAVLEELRAPLLHLVRNAIDHGIERPDARARASKPAVGRVSVSASLRGRRVEVVVEDDGCGLDLSAIREQARARALPVPDDPRELSQILFLPGFTTRSAVTQVSGRGVGLDVVKTRVEALHGTVSVESQPGAGTRFTLAVPLTLTTLRALVVEAGGQLFALVTNSVENILRFGEGDVRFTERREVVRYREGAIPVVRLEEVLGLRPRERSYEGPHAVAVVLGASPAAVAFVIDELVGEHAIVVKALGPRLRHVRNIAGAAVLGDGRIAFVLGAGELLRAALTAAPGGQVSAALARDERPAKRRVLLADDSVTTRALAKSIIEAAGYDVLVAADGEQAWRLLEAGGVDALVSDVEMPGIDGFALTAAIRASKSLRALPIVLLTSLATDEDRARGMSAGADAYLVKSAFDQRELLETLAQLL